MIVAQSISGFASSARSRTFDRSREPPDLKTCRPTRSSVPVLVLGALALVVPRRLTSNGLRDASALLVLIVWFWRLSGMPVQQTVQLDHDEAPTEQMKSRIDEA